MGFASWWTCCGSTIDFLNFPDLERHRLKEPSHKNSSSVTMSFIKGCNTVRKIHCRRLHQPCDTI
jgi:hypothetical protein